MRGSAPLFREQQRFGALVWIVLGGAAVPIAAQLIFVPSSAGALAVPLVMLAVIGLWASQIRLVTEVRSDGLIVEFRWLWKRMVIPRQRIRRSFPRRYSLSDFMGWGVRWTPWGGMALNVRGDRGLQLELTDGSRLLIGSQRPEELAEAVDRIRESA